MPDVRINRYLASCGLGSRRACEALVVEGRVALNGRQVNDLATRVTRDDVVEVDGAAVHPENKEVVLLNKPKKTLCTREDERGRETVYDLLPVRFHHLAHVGRLDRDSEGLLLLTNRGELAHELTHPASKVEKEYVVHIDRDFQETDRTAFLRGIRLPEGLARALSVQAAKPRILHIVLGQGLKRQIREMCKARGITVKRLIRVRIGGLTAPDLAPGRWRRLTAHDVLKLRGR